MAKALRCPFCHDAIAPAAADRAECAGCGAMHHAECFAEHGRCAATACGTAEVLASPDAPTGSEGGWLLKSMMFVMVAVSPSIVFGLEGLMIGLAIGLLSVAIVAALSSQKRVVCVYPGEREPMSFDPITGQWNPDAWETLRTRLEKGAREPEPEDEPLRPKKLNA